MKKVVFAVFVMALLCLPVVSAQAEVKSKYNVDFYGYVKVDTFFENGLAVQDNFLLYGFPSNTCGSPTNPNAACVKDEIRNGDKGSFGITARQTRFGFLITGPENEGGLITRARIEGDFYGTGVARSAAGNQDPEENKGLFMLRRATVELVGKNWEILAGDDWMISSPIFPMTNNYTYFADAGNLGYRMPQLRLTGYLLDKKLIFQVAAENKIGDVDFLDQDTGRMAGVPTWEAGVTWKDPKLTLGITGHYGQEMVRTYRGANIAGGPFLGDHGARVDSWSGNVHAIIPLGEMASISGEYYLGANLDGWFTGAQGDGWLVNKHGNDREALQTTGGWAQLMVSPAKPIKLYVAYGIDDPNDDQLKKSIIEPGYASKAGNACITKNQWWSGMVDYSINPATKISLEYTQLITDYSLADNTGAGAYVPAQWDPGKVDRWTLSFWYMF